MELKEIKIIKSFEYAVACLDMNLSENKTFLASIGTYKPSVKIHDLHNLTQKNERHLEGEPLKVLCLTNDATKLAILRNDRFIEFHAKYGLHERIRVPTMAYDIKLNNFSAELLSCGVSSNIYRFNLEQGRFISSYLTTIEVIRSLDINKIHGLIGVCGDSKLQFIDQRSKSVIASTQYNNSFSALSFSDNGIHFSVGSDEGSLHHFDLRSKNEIFKFDYVKEIKNVRSIGKVVFASEGSRMRIYRNFEEKVIFDLHDTINTFEVSGGVIFLGLESNEMRTFCSTELGEIPEWCNIVKVDENT